MRILILYLDFNQLIIFIIFEFSVAQLVVDEKTKDLNINETFADGDTEQTTQSVDEDGPETVVAVEDLLKRYNLKDSISETTLFRSLKHVKVPLMKHDDSFSTDNTLQILKKYKIE